VIELRDVHSESEEGGVVVHRCHASGCGAFTEQRLLMCSEHWALVPVGLKKRICSTYRDGQCDDKRPSPDWLDAAHAAIKAVKGKNGK